MSSNARASVKNRANNDPNDEMKRRARRRLVGALALFLTALVVVPALMQGEPNSEKPEIELVFPSKPQMDKEAPAPERSQSNTPSRVADAISPVVDEPVAAEPVRKPTVSTGKTDSALESHAGKVSGAVPKEAGKEATKDLAKDHSRDTEKPAASKPQESKPRDIAKPEVAVKPEVHKPVAEEPKPKKSASSEDPIAKFAQGESKAAEPKPAESKAVAKPETKSEPKAELKADNKPSYVQVAAVKDQARAEELKKELAGKGFSAKVESVTTDNGTVYRVRLGPFADAQKADQAKSDLAQKGYAARVAQ